MSGVAKKLCMLSITFFVSFYVSAIAQEDQEESELDMIYLGASWMQRAAYLFSQQAAIDLGVEVNFWQRNAGGQVSVATSKLAAGGQWDLVDDADIVIVMLTGNFGRREGYCLDTPSHEPFSESPEALRDDVGAFLAELDRNVDLNRTMVRIGLPAVKPHFRSQWVERGVVDECGREWSALLDQWREAASYYDIPVVDVTREWNGEQGIIASPVEYFGWDRVHLNEKGSQVVADLLRAGGYAPLSP